MIFQKSFAPTVGYTYILLLFYLIVFFHFFVFICFGFLIFSFSFSQIACAFFGVNFLVSKAYFKFGS